MTKTHRIGVAISVGNLLLLLALLSGYGTVSAQGGSPVLGGRGLELVDARGQVRKRHRVPQ